MESPSPEWTKLESPVVPCVQSYLHMKEVAQHFPGVKSGTQFCLSAGGGAQLISAQMILVSVTLIIE